MNRKSLKLIGVILLAGVVIGILIFYGETPILVSETGAIDNALKVDNCDKHSWKLAGTEANLFHIRNGFAYMVDKQTKLELGGFPEPNKAKFGYEWQVIITCHANGIQPSIVQWVDATTGQLVG